MAAEFELSGGHPVLDFINTLDDRFQADGPLERLNEYGDLLRFAQQTQLLDAAQAKRLAASVAAPAAAHALRSARQLREALAATLYGKLNGRAPSSDDLDVLERHFLEAQQHRQLRWQGADGGTPSWQWSGGPSQAELPLWILAQAAHELMLSSAMQQVHACGAETCRWLFLDTSKNHTRRWCNMKICGNRVKAQRFQARRNAGHRRARSARR